MPRGIFRLKQVYEDQLSNNWSGFSDVKLTESPFYGQYDNGWFVSGLSSDAVDNDGKKNLRQRIDYSNDTIIVQSDIPTATSVSDQMGSAGFGSPTHHYSVGGTNYFLGGDQNFFKFSYANDSTFIFLGGNNSNPGAWGAGAVSNTNYGYTAGGGSSSTNNRSIISRLDFSNDFANMDDRANLTLARRGLSAVGNQSYAWFGGGKGISAPTPSRYTSTTAYSTVDRFDYSNDTTNASPKGPLTGARGYLSATGNSDYGYFGGGSAPDVDNSVSSIDRVDYSNDTVTASPKGPLTSSIWGTAATGNQVFGYWSGGAGNQPVPFGYLPGTTPSNVWCIPAKSTVQRLEFANDTATALDKANLPTAVLMHHSSSAKVNANTTTTLLSSSTPKPIGHDTAYFAGGNPSVQSTVRRVDYSNDTVTTPNKGPLSDARGRLAATGNSNFGYFGGGFPGTKSTVDRIDYSNDTATASARGPLSSARYHFAGATGNANFGYFGGGRTAPPIVDYSLFERVDYSNDSVAAVQKGQLSTSTRRVAAATGNQDFGYIGGGSTPSFVSTVDRIDYSNDTVTTSPKGPLLYTGIEFAATGNSSFGYFGGGDPGTVSTVNKIDYSNDTATASSVGNLSQARRHHAATGSSSFGYFGGGFPGPISSIDRIDYSNDTATASPKGPLSASRYSLAATSSRQNGLPTTRLRSLFSIGDKTYENSGVVTNPYGYFTGGAPGPKSLIDRIDYSNDTATASPKGLLTDKTRYLASIASATHLYATAGGTNSSKSKVDRLDFSHDTTNTSPKGPLNTAKQQHAATGNKDYAWIGGGTSVLTEVDRIDYSNDSVAAAPKGNLSIGKQELAATGNQSYGYFGGGNPPGTSTVDRIDYTNDTATASPKGPLNTARSLFAATGNADYGWFGGGGDIPNPSSIVDRIDYSNDTATASPRGNLDVARSYLSGATGSSEYGYWAAGYYPAKTSISRVNYANDTATAFPRGNLTYSAYGLSAGSARANGMPQIKAVLSTYSPNPVTAATGYMYVFNNPSVFRYEYANDNIATKSAFPTPGNATSTFSSETHGYVGGAKYGGTALRRIDYSNDTTLVQTSSFSQPVQMAGSAGNRYYGYSAGGIYYPGPTGFTAITTVFRVDYSSDTDTPTPKGNLSVARKEGCGVGNQDFGYFAGTSAPSTDRIDYSNDTATATPKGGIGSNMSNRQATGNANYGYFGVSSLATRLDYSNDTADGVTKGSLLYTTYYAAASGNKNFGYWMGGFSSGSYANMVKFNFNNDTASAVFKTVLGEYSSTGFYDKFATSAAENGLPQP